MKKIKPKESELNEQFITEYADIVDWCCVSIKMDISLFSKEFFHKFKSEIYFWALAECNKSITTEFAHEWEIKIGSKRWYENGLLHREDGPAKIYADGAIKWFWYKKGKLTNSPPNQTIEYII